MAREEKAWVLGARLEGMGAVCAGLDRGTVDARLGATAKLALSVSDCVRRLLVSLSSRPVLAFLDREEMMLSTRGNRLHWTVE